MPFNTYCERGNCFCITKMCGVFCPVAIDTMELHQRCEHVPAKIRTESWQSLILIDNNNEIMARIKSGKFEELSKTEMNRMYPKYRFKFDW